MITRAAYAKINLTLDIVGRRGDGYHLLESVMQTVSLYDTVGAERADEIVIECDAPNVPTDRRNTCFKAAERFFEYTGISGGAKIVIEKRIPSEAGLAGGSADAAAALWLLNEIYGAGLGGEELESIAAKVGADVAFCVRGGAAVCRGIGEEMESISDMPERFVLLVKPDFGVSTPEAYRLFDEKGIRTENGTKKFLSAPKRGETPFGFISNDLETALANPVIEKIKKALFGLGAEAAQMTGSGSCVFGLFKSEKDAENAKHELAGNYPFVELCRTI